MPSSMTPTTDPALMRKRALLLLARMPDLMGQLDTAPKEAKGIKDSLQMAILGRALPGLFSMAELIIAGMADERLMSFVDFIRNTMVTMGDPDLSDEQFEAFLNGNVIDGTHSSINTNAKSIDAAIA